MVKKLGHPHNFRALSKPKQLAKNQHHHYWPYIPVLLLVIVTFLVSVIGPVQKRGVLAYATSMSSSALLASTNQERTKAGSGTLTINNRLSAAAQAKANDMVARNYWSHNTPDGHEPWIFIQNAGYSYLKAGENLAYGFDNGADTVAGWMNSASHKANLLDSAFTEVGFGFANSENYNGTGQETVVVAMYGKPQVLASGGSAPVIPTSPTPAAITTATQTAPQTSNTSTQTVTPPTGSNIPVNTEAPVLVEPTTQNISRIQALTGGRMPWAVFAVGIITGAALVLLLARHAAGLRHIIRDSEKFILHHPLLDTVLVSLVLAGTLLSQNTGFIK